MMKRIIIFRGKCKNTGKWVFGSLLNKKESCHIVNNSKTDVIYDVDKNTVGEFTGLKDHKEQRIYEGDIIRFWYDETVVLVKWNSTIGMWSAQFRNSLYIDVRPLGKLLSLHAEIIGNIHDNPCIFNTKVEQ